MNQICQIRRVKQCRIKTSLWKGGIRVPALIHWKGVIEPRKSTELFSALDIMPTFMSIIGHPIKNMESEGVHGIDQSKMIFLGQVNKVQVLWDGHKNLQHYTVLMP